MESINYEASYYKVFESRFYYFLLLIYKQAYSRGTPFSVIQTVFFHRGDRPSYTLIQNNIKYNFIYLNFYRFR